MRRRLPSPVTGSDCDSRLLTAISVRWSENSSAIRTITTPSVAVAKPAANAVHRRELVVDLESHRHRREEGGNREQPAALEPECPGAGGRDPGGERQEQGGQQPQGVDGRVFERAAGGIAIQVDAVRDRVHGQSERDQDEAPARAPAGERDRPDHEADQEQVAERVGDIDGHGFDVALCGPLDRAVQDRGPHRGDRQRADRSVEPQARVEARHARAHEQRDPRVRGGEQHQPGGVRQRRVGDLLLVGQVEGPVGVADRPGRDARPDQDPRRALAASADAARKAHQGACRQHQRVEPVVDERVRRGSARAEHGVRDVDQQRCKRREKQQAYRPRHGAVQAGKHRFPEARRISTRRPSPS